MIASKKNDGAERGANQSAMLRQAVEHHRAGRAAAAKRLYDKVLSAHPSQPDALNLSGVLALEHGRFDHAIRLISKAVTADPNNADAHSNLGNAFRAAGRSTEARLSYERAIALRPTLAVAHCNLGVVRLDCGELNEAIQCFETALAIDKSLVEASLALATAHRRRGDLAAAEFVLDGIVQARPELAEPKAALASVLAEQGRFALSFDLYASAIALAPDARQHRLRFAKDLTRSGRLDDGAREYRSALDLDRRDPASWNELGRVLRSLGDLVEARDCFTRAIKSDPGLADAHRNLALLSERQGADVRIARLRAIRTARRGKEDDVLASFALGKIFDDEHRFDEAFESYEIGNRLMVEAHCRDGRGFDIEALRGIVDRKMSEFVLDRSVFRSSSELPVFIVGMPRSGTSLVEQIAASHSRVHGAGELRELMTLGVAYSTRERATVSRAVEAYLAHLEQIGGGAARVIDKMPDNVFHLDVVASLLPKARVIVCERDARDVSLSCYFQLFTSGNEFSYDLGACGRRQVQTARLADHWRRTLDLQILTISYEKLVSDLEGESRRLIAFLGLDWEADCLQFHQTRRVVATASGWQVRQPIYDRSINRWRNYQSHITVLETALADEAAVRSVRP